LPDDARSAVYSYCINRTGPMTRTAAEIAAFKAQNLAQRPTVHVIQRAAKPVRKSQRQEFTELLAETRDMIAAAKRQGHWQLLPALLQRAATFQTMLDNRALA
jgi:hypothetical protein